METESENFEMTVEAPEEVSVTSETEGTFSEGVIRQIKHCLFRHIKIGLL